MARVLELVDETGDESRPTGDTATLESDGQLTYKGDRVQEIIGKWLVGNPPDEVFDNMSGWSNGYISLREREGEG